LYYQKLAALLKLPPKIDLVKARVLLLRLTIPVDIYGSPIVVEVDGVEVHVRISSELSNGGVAPRSPTNHDRKRKRRDRRERSSAGSDTETSRGVSPGGGEQDLNSALPTVADLAASFLETEPPEEKAELEAAISSQSQILGASVAYSDEGDDDYALGTGTELTLPSFMTNFLKGIVDRLEVRVRRITLDADVEVSSQPLARPETPSSTEIVTLQLKIDDVDIEGVTFGRTETAELHGKQGSTHKVIHKDGKRQINLRKIRGQLISDPGLFTSMARSIVLSSPGVTHSGNSEPTESIFKPPLNPRSSSSRATGNESAVEHGLVGVLASGNNNALSDSTLAGENSRFDDAPEDERNMEWGDHRPVDVPSDMDNSVFDQSAYLDQVSDSQIIDENDDGDDDRPPFAFTGRPSGHHLDTSRRTSPLSTPRASVYMPPPPDSSQSYLENSRARFTNSQTSITSGRAHRPQRSFVERTESRSRTLTEPEDSIHPEGRHPSLANSSSHGSHANEEDLSDASDNSTPSPEDDLAQSMIFSHEDAESMYMSALSHGSTSARIPGAWDSSAKDLVEHATMTRSPSIEQSQNSFPDNPEHVLQTVASDVKPESLSTLDEIAASSSKVLSTSIPKPEDSPSPLPKVLHLASTPPKQQMTNNSSTQSSASSEEYTRVSKQLFGLDQVTIYLPSADVSNKIDLEEDDARSVLSASNLDGQSRMSQSFAPAVPGAFSPRPVRQPGHLPRPDKTAEKTSPTATINDNRNLVEVIVGKLQAQFDISVGRLMARLLNSISDAVSDGKSTPQEKSAMPSFALHFRADRISLKFLERLTATSTSAGLSVSDDTWIKPPPQDVLLRTTLKGLNIDFDTSENMTRLSSSLQKFVLGYAKENIVSFDADLRMRASTKDLAPSAGVDLAINATRTPTSSHLKISTLPIHVSIDLQKLDETFSWFGGLSSVLNMGSSMASNATITAASPSKPTPKSRVVRFEAPTKSDDVPVIPNKLEARIGGFVLDLVGKDCIVGMETTAVKIIGRDEGLGIAIDKIKISGPHLNRPSGDPAIHAELHGTRLEFVATPKNDDLDRLLSLITPSKAKYDRDDDILLETLLRQRRQGSVLRVTVEQFKMRVSKLDDLRFLPELGEEVSRLSTVAKYLPEDDRPGLLTLLLIRDVDVQVEVNDRLGSFQLDAADLEIAHITFPALVAFSINTIAIYHNGKEELLGAATDIELREVKNRSPAIMARMIGDEMEPIIKVKLWNIRAEYSVPLLMNFLGLSEMATTEEVVSSIAASVATLTEATFSGPPVESRKENTKGKESKSPDSKAMILDFGLRECILALNPLGLPSKVLVVMTEAHVSAVLPRENNASATVEMSKGSLLVIDDVANISAAGVGKMRRRSFDGGSSQVADLCAAGFVSVSYFSSAKAVIRVTGATDEAEKYIDVELRDDLLVMESCADSTQTLIAALNGLKPPMPPSQEVKYRTKVIPVQDLLASLSGDAFGTAEGNYDFDEDFGPAIVGGAETGEDDEDTSELDFNSHYYQEEDSLEHHDDSRDYEESRQGSVLFDQLQSQDTNDGVLLESFSEREQVHIQEELHFQEDHFGSGSILEGTAHRWNSAKNTYDRSNDQKVRNGPLKVRVRDVHIIWNLFDGYDWQHTRDAISKAVQDVESKAIEQRARNDRRSTFDQDIAEEETVIGDFLFNSIYIGIPANRDPRELAMAINQELNDNATETESVTTTSLSASPSRQGNAPRVRGKKLRLHRSKHHKITFELKGVNVDLVVFPPGSGETESSIDVRVHDFDIFDHVPTSTWKKFATYMHDAGERESGTSQIHIEMLNVKPVPELAASEIVLKATVLPLRLHVDQDALDFITRFFEFKDDSAPTHTSKSDVPFLQRVEVNSIPVKLDFKPKRVDYAGLRSGHTTEFMNFLVLDEADMVLRHTIIYGISGFDKLGKCLNDIWMPDIKRNQLPGILAGLAPVRSLANVGGGMRDLIVIPMREYRKDGRIVRSISKGAFAFARTTGTELVKLGAKLAIGTQTVLQGAEEFLSKPPSRDTSSAAWEDDELDEEERKQISLYADQPIGVVQGLRGGYASLERDLLMARDAIIAVPGEVMESGTAQGAARAVLRRAPTVILRPVIGASKAIGQTLMGATNSLDPQNRRRVEDVSLCFLSFPCFLAFGLCVFIILMLMVCRNTRSIECDARSCMTHDIDIFHESAALWAEHLD
jgi:autophagy-related protein 2